MGDNYNCGGRECPKSFECGGGCVQKCSIVGGKGWIGKYKSYDGGWHYIQFGGYEEEKVIIINVES